MTLIVFEKGNIGGDLQNSRHLSKVCLVPFIYRVEKFILLNMDLIRVFIV